MGGGWRECQATGVCRGPPGCTEMVRRDEECTEKVQSSCCCHIDKSLVRYDLAFRAERQS
jgi:hypothetical protein